MITFTSGATEVATLSRGTTVYATGAAKSTRLSLYARRVLRPGHYELTLTGRTNDPPTGHDPLTGDALVSSGNHDVHTDPLGPQGPASRCADDWWRGVTERCFGKPLSALHACSDARRIDSS